MRAQSILALAESGRALQRLETCKTLLLSARRDWKDLKVWEAEEAATRLLYFFCYEFGKHWQAMERKEKQRAKPLETARRY